MHMAAINPDASDMPVRAFGTFTQDLNDLAAWFRSCGVTSVAMESTGVYWLSNGLKEHGFEVILVNERYAKNVPGRETDVNDAALVAATALLRALARQFPARSRDRHPADLHAPARTVV
ncbi:MAG: transposase [Silicimonas sp.]